MLSLKKYEPHKVEEMVAVYWKENEIYKKVKEKNKGKRKFYFLDGPPYPSSNVIHVGTGWNKVIKDTVLRYRRMQGFDVWDQPGYDCHGLPIELAVEKSLKFKSKKDIENYGIKKFVNKCKELALSNVEALTRQFEDLGIFMSWDSPYLTLKNDYIESGWWLVKEADKKGLLDRGLKVMHWCPRCETVLSDYEVTEYRDIADPSIFVKFPVIGKENEYILIWTTTPWTLPANMGVMVHPDYEYVRVKVGEEILILSKERLQYVLGNETKYEILEVFPGRKLSGLKYRHPLEEEVPIHKEFKNAHYVVLSSEFVHLEEGTGCVHTAPGHGEEDFEVGLEYNLPIFSPVDDKGRYTEEAGKYKGLFVRDANRVIIDDLKRKGLLFREEKITHKYPVCWRCKTPLIFRATKQWFISISKLKDKMINESERVNWIPEWAGKNRFKNWISNAKDWVISRQRYWGTPLPIWVCEKCGHRKVIGSKDELLKLATNVKELDDLHRPHVDNVIIRCEKCGGKMHRVPDIMDVWFDSGVSFYASLKYPKDKKLKELWPVDFIVEGHDQISGWFYSLMRAGIIGFDRAPYETVLMHGFALDEKGHEMHKSLGNFVSTVQAIEPYGRDVFRLYVLSNTIWEDLKFSWNIMKEVYNDLNVAWNVFNFASTYMLLDNFKATNKTIDYDSLLPEDKWIVSKLNSLIKDVTKYMNEYKLHLAAHLLRDFIVDDISRIYIKLIRRRVWIEEAAETKIIAYNTLYYILYNYLILAAPFIPFFTEYWFHNFVKKVYDTECESLHLCNWPTYNEKFIDTKLEEQAKIVFQIIERALSIRSQAGIKIRQPLPSLTVYSDNPDIKDAISLFSNVVSSLTNVKEIYLRPVNEIADILLTEIRPVYPSIGKKYRALTKDIVKQLQRLNPKEVEKILSEKGELYISVDNKEIVLSRDDIEIIKKPLEGYEIGEFEYGFIVLNKEISDRERIEGLVRDIVRRIQYMRKILDLPVDGYIEVFISAKSNMINDIRIMEDYIKTEARIKKMTYAEKIPQDMKLIKKWRIDGEDIEIGINPL